MPKAGRLHVILVRTRNPLNIGAVARAMSNFGFDSLRVVNPYTEAFREARSVIGAAQLLKDAQQFKSVAEAVADAGLTSSVSTRTAAARPANRDVRGTH